MQAKLSNTSVKCIPLGSKTCIVRAEFITPLIFTPLISSSEPRRQFDFIRRLIIHLTKRCQPCLCHHPPSTSRLPPWISRTLVLSMVHVLTVLKASHSRPKVLTSLLTIRWNQPNQESYCTVTLSSSKASHDYSPWITLVVIWCWLSWTARRLKN